VSYKWKAKTASVKGGESARQLAKNLTVDGQSMASAAGTSDNKYNELRLTRLQLPLDSSWASCHCIPHSRRSRLSSHRSRRERLLPLSNLATINLNRSSPPLNLVVSNLDTSIPPSKLAMINLNRSSPPSNLVVSNAVVVALKHVCANCHEVDSLEIPSISLHYSKVW